jgi:hypothetical protein
MLIEGLVLVCFSWSSLGGGEAPQGQSGEPAGAKRVAATQEELGAAQLERLIAIWEGQRSESVTGRFQVRLFRAPRNPANLLSPQEVVQIFESSEALRTGGPKAIEFLDGLRETFIRIEPGVERFWGERIEVLLEGRKVRESWAPSDVVGSETKVNLFDGETELRFSPHSNQVSLLPGRELVMIDERTLRYVPEPRPDSGFEGWRIQSEAAGLVTLTTPWGLVVAEVSSGFVHRYELHDASGAVRRAIMQFGPVVYPNRIVLPTTTIHSDYPDGKLGLLSIYVIEEAEINVELGKDAFVLSAPPGRRVVDFRSGRDQYKDLVTDRAVSDVLEYADMVGEYESGEVASSEVAPGSRQWLWIGLAVVVALSCVVLILMLRSAGRRRQVTDWTFANSG